MKKTIMKSVSSELVKMDAQGSDLKISQAPAVLCITWHRFTVSQKHWTCRNNNHLLQAVASVENDWRQQNVEEYFGVKCHLKKEGEIQT